MYRFKQRNFLRGKVERGLNMKGITCPKCDEYILTAPRKKELKARPAEVRDLKTLIHSIYDVQHMRMIFEGRFRATNETMYGLHAERLFELESQMKDDAEYQMKNYPISQWIIAQKGISYDMAAQFIGLVEDISKFKNVSSLWSYAGMGVIQVCDKCSKKYLPVNERPQYILKTSMRLMEQYKKKIVKEGSTDFNKKADAMLCHCENPVPKASAQRRIKGTLLDYNPTLKSLCWRFGKQFVMQGDYYRKLYDQFRAEYELREDLVAEMNGKVGKKTKHGESKGTGHIHNMAQRKTVKIFLSHLWTTWRELDGLEVSKPWVISVGGHSDYIAPPGPTVEEIMKDLD